MRLHNWLIERCFSIVWGLCSENIMFSFFYFVWSYKELPTNLYLPTDKILGCLTHKLWTFYEWPKMQFQLTPKLVTCKTVWWQIKADWQVISLEFKLYKEGNVSPNPYNYYRFSQWKFLENKDLWISSHASGSPPEYCVTFYILFMLGNQQPLLKRLDFNCHGNTN